MKVITEKLISWVRDYLNSFGGKTKAIIGISGGKDSTIAAKICVEAVGADRVIGVRMPQGEQHDLDVAKDVCSYLGIKSYEFGIETIQWAFNSVLSRDFSFEDELLTNPVYYSNNPARIRMTMLYAIAALLGDSRVVNTCNRSEDYVGYSTKFGDSAGDFSPLSNLCVREVLQIGEDLGVPKEFIYKAPEDGLSGKTDEDNLGFTYAELDAYLLDGVKPSDEILANIEKRHKQNLHKVLPMPSFVK